MTHLICQTCGGMATEWREQKKAGNSTCFKQTIVSSASWQKHLSLTQRGDFGASSGGVLDEYTPIEKASRIMNTLLLIQSLLLTRPRLPEAEKGRFSKKLVASSEPYVRLVDLLSLTWTGEKLSLDVFQAVSSTYQGL